MAKNLIPEELDALIQQYLTDGVLTDKERQVILNKAEKMGLDRDEIDLYLDAEVQKIDQQSDVAVRKAKSKACPYCGAPIPLLTDKCPACGQFITPQASEELQEIINNLEEALVSLKSGTDIKQNKAIVDRYVRKGKLYYSNNPKLRKLLDEVEQESLSAEKNAINSARQKKIIHFLLQPLVIALFVAALIAIPFSIKYDKEANILATMEETHGDKTKIIDYEPTPYEEQAGDVDLIVVFWVFSTLGILGTGLYFQVNRKNKE